MNTGVVSSRYASALLKYVGETGNGERVYSQVSALSGSLAAVEQLRAIIDNPMAVSDRQKYDLLVTALDGEPMAEELRRFIRLVMRNKRTKMLRLIFLSFLDQYRKANGIKVSRLITAVPAPELEQKLSQMAKEKSGDTVLFEHLIDPAIIGGFIFEIDGLRVDASVSAQFKSVKRQFVEKNRRIV